MTRFQGLDTCSFGNGGVYLLEDKKVSIIVPVYNVSEYLNESIASACNQTYENIEIIQCGYHYRDN